MGLLNLKKIANNNDVPTANSGYGTIFLDSNGVPRVKDESGDITDFTVGVGFVNGVLGNVSLTNFDITQWDKNIGNLGVPDTDEYNIFNGLAQNDKTPVSSTGAGAINVTSDSGGQDFIQMNWRGQKEFLNIRVSMELQQGGTDFYRLQLRRKSNDTIISVHPFSMNSTDQPEDIVTVNIKTFISAATDSFITGGFYIVLANNSGGNVTISNNINILINRSYQKPIAESV